MCEVVQISSEWIDDIPLVVEWLNRFLICLNLLFCI
jgi:hypothetical protein